MFQRNMSFGRSKQQSSLPGEEEGGKKKKSSRLLKTLILLLFFWKTQEYFQLTPRKNNHGPQKF